MELLPLHGGEVDFRLDGFERRHLHLSASYEGIIGNGLSHSEHAMYMRVPIADRYILKELLGPFLLGIAVFIVILIGDILYTLAEFIAAGRVTIDTILKLLAYKMPAVMVITFPVSTLIGTLLGLGKLAKNREVQAMRLFGMSLLRIFAPVLAFGLAVAGLTLVTNEFIAPWANHQANNLIRRAAFAEAFTQVRTQVFFRGPGQRFFYVDRVDDNQRVLHNVMIYEAAGPLPRLITARRATLHERKWSLTGGVIREFDETGFTRYEAQFASMEIAVGVDSGVFFAGQKTPEEMTAKELRRYLALFSSGGAATMRFAVEYHRKFAVPFAAAVFALVAAPLSVQTEQGGRFLGAGLGVVLLFIYYVAMSIARAMGGVGALSPILSAWLPNVLFAICGILLWVREEG